MAIGNYENPKYPKITLPDELLQNSNIGGLIEEVKLDESDADNSNNLITTLGKNTDRNNLCDMLTVGRSNFSSSDVATSPIDTITPKRNTYKTLNHKDIMDIASTLSSASQRNNRFGLVVSGMLLYLLNVAE